MLFLKNFGIIETDFRRKGDEAMKKRLIASLTVMMMLHSAVYAVYAQEGFTDLAVQHWAYEAVTELVSKGTVSGYEDGSFRPDGLVTRAEFVKMIGPGESLRAQAFDDVPAEYWAYQDIMYSGLEAAEGNMFAPDRAITRGETIGLLWQRGGKPEEVYAPSVITKQAENKKAAAFVYTYGIMNGDDGVNLRLGETLTRAEAAALIVRGAKVTEETQKVDFVDKVSPEILQRVYEGIPLFEDTAYQQDKTFKNGEMANAALRLASDGGRVAYEKFPAYDSGFEHAYAKDLAIVANQCIGTDKLNAAFAEKEANHSDTLAALVYGMVKRANSMVNTGNADNYYADIKGELSGAANSCLTFAYENGIFLYGDGTLRPDSAVTAKEFAAVLLQLDDLIGSQTALTTDGQRVDYRIQKSAAEYPERAGQYACVLEGVPAAVYNAEFTMLSADKTADPKATYETAKGFRESFVKQLQKLVKTAEDSYGVTLRFTYFPSLVYDNGKGFSMRVLCEILDPGEGKDYEALFGKNTIQEISGPLEKGQKFYLEITTKYDIFN